MFTILVQSLLTRVALSDSTCGDGNGHRCGSAFSHYKCGTGESCCHDDFNTWCCPPKYKCQGSYKNPGNNRHCMEPEHHSSSCLCTDVDYHVEGLEAAGPAIPDGAVEISDFPMNCPAGAANCGFTDTISWSQQKTMEWSTSVTDTFKMEAGFAIPDIGSASVSTTISGTWTNGETKSDTLNIDISTQCHSGLYGFEYPTRVLLTANVIKMSQEVTLEYDQCGNKDTATAKVTATLITGKMDCVIVPSTRKCDQSDGWDFYSNEVNALKVISDVDHQTDCSRHCAAFGTACEFWTYHKSSKMCYLRHLFESAEPDSNSVSGMRCDDLSPRPTTSPTVKPTYAPTRAPTLAPTTKMPTAAPTQSPTPPPSGCTNSRWSQCGGNQFSGPTCCPESTSCFEQSEWYSQCLESCPSSWDCNTGLLGSSPRSYTQTDNVSCRKQKIKIEKHGVMKTYKTRNIAKARAYCDALGDDCIGVLDSGCNGKGKYNLCEASDKPLRRKPGHCIHMKEN